MAWPAQIAFPELLTFGLVLVRVSTLVMIAPLFGTANVPARVRVLVSAALALLIMPVELARSSTVPGSAVEYLVQVGGEALIGLSLGLGVRVLFTSLQVAGQVICQMSGMQLADVFDPGFDAGSPVFAKLLLLVTTAVFVALGGYRRVMEALLDTFLWLPAGRGGLSRSMTEAMTSLLAGSFELGLRIAAPVMVAVLLATLILGLAGRTLPQLNIFAFGFGLSAVVTLASLAAALGTATWTFHDALEPALDAVLQALKSR